MVAYFRLQNNLFMAAGAALGALIAVAVVAGGLYSGTMALVPFLVGMCAIAGVVLGRLFASAWAGRKLNRIKSILYTDNDPAGFLEVFLPIARKVPVQTVEHVDAKTRIAYAYEILGEFDKGLDAMADLKPEGLRVHSMQGTALMVNQRMRLQLLKGDAEAARREIDRLTELQAAADALAPTLGKQIAECVKLGTAWLHILQDEDADLAYIREEIELAKNKMHRAEMLWLLGQGLRNEGNLDEAGDCFVDASHTLPGLYASEQAKLALASL